MEEAIAAVNNGQTIIMLQDVSYGTPLTINNSKTFTIDFKAGATQYSFRWFDMVGSHTDKDIFTIENNSNVTVKNMKYLIGLDEKGNRVFKVNNTGKLTLINMICDGADNIKDTPVVNNGGTVVIDGGNITTSPSTGSVGSPIVQNLNYGTITFKGNGSYKTGNSTGAIWLGNLVTTPSGDTDTPYGNVTIDNGTFTGGPIFSANGKGNIIINNATCDNANCSIYVLKDGIKSKITIKNITASSNMLFAMVLAELETKIDFQNGSVKYKAGKFCGSSSSINSVSIKNGKFGPSSGSTDIHDEIEGFLASGATITSISEGGYTYKVTTPSPTPSPSPYHGGGSGGGGGGGGGVGSPRYDLEGNVLGPSGIMSYAYDGTNPPDLNGNINMFQWNYYTVNIQVADIHYVQNTDSFVRGNNTPVIGEWVGITSNINSRVLWYRTNANGQLVRNQFIRIGNDFYYFDNNGIMATGQRVIDGVVYNFETTVGITEGRFLYYTY